MNLLITGAGIGFLIGTIIAFIYSLIKTKGAPKSRKEALAGKRGNGPGCGQLLLIIMVFTFLGAILGFLLAS